MGLEAVRSELSFFCCLCCSAYTNLDLFEDESAPESIAFVPQHTRQRRYGHDFSGESCHHHRHHPGPHPHGPPGGFGFGFDGWHGPPPPAPPFGFVPFGENNPRQNDQVPHYRTPLAPFNGGINISKVKVYLQKFWPFLDDDVYNPGEQQQPTSASTSIITSSTSTSTSTTTSTTTEDPTLGIDLRFGKD